MIEQPQNPTLPIHGVSRCPLSDVYLEDCVQGLKRFADKHFDLAIVDPPYGINISSAGGYYHVKGKGQANPHTKKDWDNGIPNAEYWEELFRVSKNQIVWGGNILAAIELAKLAKDFADKGMTDEAMDIPSSQWVEVIGKLESKLLNVA